MDNVTITDNAISCLSLFCGTSASTYLINATQFLLRNQDVGRDAVIQNNVHHTLGTIMKRSSQDSTTIEILNFYKTLAKGHVSDL
jgi:hypothetical protein